MKITRVFDVLQHQLKNYDLEIALAGKKKGAWVTYSTKQFIEMVDYVSFGLLATGVKKGDKIAVIANSSPEWNFIDMGVQQIGAVHVPLFPNISDEHICHILNETEAEIIFLANRFLLLRIKQLLPQLKFLKQIYILGKIKGEDSFSDLIELGKKNKDHYKLEKIKEDVKTEDLATILYTSGTTSAPKGVMLSHSNLTSIFDYFIPTLKLGSGYNAIIHLSLSHIGIRKCNYTFLYSGFPIYYGNTIDPIYNLIQEIKPQIMAFVPFLLEKIYDYFVSIGEQLSGKEKEQFFWAHKLAIEYDPEKLKNKDYKEEIELADKLVFHKWREMFGGNIKRIIVGGASVPEHLLRFFWAAGIPIHEVYGLTETSSLFAINHHGEVKFGTVGKPIKGIEVKIAEDGEILCRGKNVMKGYLKKSELTKEVIDKEGFFHSGDIGEIDDEGFLTITGRKSEVFKTTAGDFISPEAVENKVKESLLISQAMVVGANKSFLSALIVPEFNALKTWCENNNIEFIDSESIVKNESVIRKFKKEIDIYNKNRWDTERILKFHLLTKEWTVNDGQLSQMMKLKRKFIFSQNEDVIDGFYF